MSDAATEGSDGGLRRVLGPVDATCVVVGAIIGVGIFFQPQAVAKAAGSGGVALLAWAVGGGIALLGALTFAELGGMYRRSGGQYEILRDAFGALPAFLFVFCNATAVQAGAMAIIAIVCAMNLAVAVGAAIPGPMILFLLSAGLVLGLALANVLGVKQGSRVQNVTVFAKVATLLLITALALLFGEESISGEVTLAVAEGAGAAPEEGGGGKPFLALLFAALVPTLFSFGGWQHGLWIGGEVRDPARNLPRAILAGMIVVVVVYLLANMAYLWLLGPSGVAGSGTLAADAVSQVWPDWGKQLIAAAVAFSAFGVLNAQLLSGPRLIYAMARDGRFFPRFAEVSARTSTPVPAILLLGALAMVLLIVTTVLALTGATAGSTEGVELLTVWVVFVDTVFFILTGVSLFVLRRRRPDAERPVRVPGYPVVPALFVMGETAVLVGALVDFEKLLASLIGLGWIGVAFVLYHRRFRRSV